MLPRRLRLPGATLKDLRGFTKRSSQFFIIRSKDNRLGHPRFAAVVSAKVDRRATARHAAKRRITARLRQKVAADKDVAVIALPPAKNLPRKNFFEELDKLL